MGEDEAAQQSERYAEDDGQGNEEAFVETAEDEVDKDDTDDEHQGGGVLC